MTVYLSSLTGLPICRTNEIPSKTQSQLLGFSKEEINSKLSNSLTNIDFGIF